MNYTDYIECFANNLENNQFITVRKKSGNLFASIVTMNASNPTSVPIDSYVGQPSKYFTYNGRTITGFKSEALEYEFMNSSEPFIETYANKIQSIVLSSKDITKTTGQLSWNRVNSPINRNVIFLNVTEVDELGLSKCDFTNLDLPKCTTIGDKAFAYSKIKDINCPEAISIGSYSFLRSDVEEINIPKYDMSEYDSEAIGAFCQCTKLSSMTVKNINIDATYFYLGILCPLSSPTTNSSSVSNNWWYWNVLVTDSDGNTFRLEVTEDPPYPRYVKQFTKHK